MTSRELATRTAAAAGLRLIGDHDLAGHGDGMQVLREGDALYVGHTGTTGAGTSILDVTDPARPELVAQWAAPPHTHTHKVQVADGLLLVNHEQFPYGGEQRPCSAGMAVYRLTDPFSPEQVGFWATGGRGVHRIVYTGGRFAYLSATPDGCPDRIWMIVDLSDPANPATVGQWSWPGTWTAGRRYAAHHALLDGDLAYLGFDDANLVVLDVREHTNPVQIGHLTWDGGNTHTCLPMPDRGILVVTDEQVRSTRDAPDRMIRIVDIADPSRPRVLAVCPQPNQSYRVDGARYGPHNLHENRPASYRSQRLVFATYFSAGVRVYDLADPLRPCEVAYWVPEPAPGQPAAQTNDVFVDAAGLIYVTDRTGGGMAILAPEPALAQLMKDAADTN